MQSAGYRRLAADEDEALEVLPMKSLEQRERGQNGNGTHGEDKVEDDDADDEALLDTDAYPESGHFREEDSSGESAADIVRKVVSETDDPTMPALTIRVFVLGLLLCSIGASVSQLFYFKSNAPTFSSFFIVLVSYPLGRWMARVLPERTVSVLGFNFSLNPGPFSVKEHVLIGVLASSGASASYAGDITAIQDLYYHQDIGIFGGLLLLVSSQLLGFGLSGAVHKILVRPTTMIWPGTLVFVSLFNTLHGEGDILTQKRLRLFSIAFLAIFAYQFLPAVVAPTLTSIAFLCLIDNNSPILRVFGSGYNGLGFLDFSLDWAVVGSTGGLFTPFWASMNYFTGFAFAMWIVMPIIYLSDVWNSQSFDSPVSAQLYDRFFNPFNISSVINADLTLNEEAWESRGPILLTPAFALSYGTAFAVVASAVTTVLLWHLAEIRKGLSSDSSTTDVHVQMLEKSYLAVPRSWYACVGVSMIASATFLVVFYPLQLPVLGLWLAIAMGAVFLIPVGIIAGMTGTVIGLNVITEFVAGFILPGRPLANVTFKVFGYMTLAQALDLCADLKLALYCKIPPRAMFVCQCLGTAVGAVINYVFIKGVIDSKRDYLDGTLVDPTGQWDGRKPKIFFSASVIWGLIGPARFFSGQYSVLYWGFLVGVVLSFIPWLLHRRFPKSRIPFQKISLPLMFQGALGPPQVPTNVIIVGFLSAFISQYWAARYRPQWFERYNYVLSSALDSGTAVNALVVYLIGLQGFRWWMNPDTDSEHCRPGS